MHNLALLLKSYREDLAYAERLFESFSFHNPTLLHMYVMVPDQDVILFSHLNSPCSTVLAESELSHQLVSEGLAGLTAGYINQQIVKLSFWELGLASNYFCIDSDAIIIRDITVDDFLAPDGFPYTVMVEDRELKVEPRYYQQYWKSRETALQRINSEIGLADPVIRTCHGHQIFSSDVLRSFKHDFLDNRKWSYADALEVAPYEFSWYTLWLQASREIPVHSIEPLVKVFHHEEQHFEYAIRRVTEEDMARGYLAVVLNSNFSRDLGLNPITGDKVSLLAPYLSYQEVVRLISTKLRDSIRRRI